MVYKEGAGNRERHRNKPADCKTEIAADPPAPQKQTAAQAGPLNGGNGIEKHSGAFNENSYHDGASAAMRAAQWYAENRDNCPRPIVPTLKRMFGVSALEAVQAIQTANGGAR
ncbi:hypothetical protein [Chelativorans intermedius]|uniref:Uncharacterized protein n=1 Tax=Chelativorans intermedius TaxID=515947 RepID=A0ABV6DC78_9HYPH|nr:hypothetical protein [Chelativorans intermedius]MCT8999623.1 hypothetical protein [Chelativorans intermedius]